MFASVARSNAVRKGCAPRTLNPRSLASIVPNVPQSHPTTSAPIPLSLASVHASTYTRYQKKQWNPNTIEDPVPATISIATPGEPISFKGQCYGAPISSSGEVVFTTAMTAYPESLTDPSYAGQILVLTQPLVGNYGVPGMAHVNGLTRSYESFKIHARGLIVQNYTWQYSHREALMSLGHWCAAHNVPLVSGIDTRELVFLLRNAGSSMGSINVANSSTVVTPKSLKNELFQVPAVSTSTPVILKNHHSGVPPKYKVALMDYGVKHNIIRQLLKFDDVEVTLLPWNYPIQDYVHEFDGLVLSNGPGDPIMMDVPVHNIKCLTDSQKDRRADRKTPIMGVCMGHQVLGLAAGYSSYKLKFGNRGHNQPCLNLVDGGCIITSQNHGYALDDSCAPANWVTYYRNANDGSNEGIMSMCGMWRSVQFHPEAWGGPKDSIHMFDDFYRQVEASYALNRGSRTAPAYERRTHPAIVA